MFNILSFLEIHRCIFYAIANACMFFEFLPYILKAFPKSFTFGEACTISQGIAVFVFSSFISINRLLLNSSNFIQNDLDIAAVVLRVSQVLVCRVKLFLIAALRNLQFIYYLSRRLFFTKYPNEVELACYGR